MKHLPLYCMLAMPLYLFGQKDYSVIYKKTATQELHIEILEPKGKMPKEGFPAVVFSLAEVGKVEKPNNLLNRPSTYKITGFSLS